MRKMLFLVVIFAVLLAPAAAQTKLRKPKITFLAQGNHKTHCLTAVFDKVKRAESYEVWVTKVGKGMLQYRPDTPESQKIRGWHGVYYQSQNGHQVPTVRLLGGDERDFLQVWWCNLKQDQTVRFHVRAVSKNGKVGPARKSVAFHLKEGWPVEGNWWTKS
ncbi:MAG: hypothetical protein OXH48_04750 [Chloroflexi bacterium]|nr:hypothetical protein [Chloroflexota bacterium]MXX52051.1 hypothetical protein [Chloroflexota bacterium]MYE79046.1 hypothetical protein [Chloroflexota bacterium]